MNNNVDVRRRVVSSGLKLWQIAEKLGISEFTFSRKLRHELPQEMKERIYAIIAELAEREGTHAD